MSFITGVKEKETISIGQVSAGNYEEKVVKMNGSIHTIRDMGDIAFVVLRKSEGLFQCVFEKGKTEFDFANLREAMTIEVEGVIKTEERAPHGIELRIQTLKVLSKPAAAMPIPISKWKLSSNLETILDLRPVSLRNIRERAKFKIQEGIVRGFRDYLYGQGFTEIRTPKIVSRGAEGGANIFKLDYFGKKAELAQSPQVYKQTMVGVYDKVFEVGPVFRAEKHNTHRHLNEYTGLDFEMGYIDSFEDIMEVETEFLQYTLELLKREYKKELDILKINLPSAERIPAVRFDEAKKNVSEKYNRPIRNPYDLEPEEEKLISQYYKEECDADFVFITHYPTKKRPFYAMEDPADNKFTLSFDLLFRGVEITTGGQRIHDYQELTAKMEKRGMTTEGMEAYLMIFKYGMPPHGGLGIGLERLTMKIIEEENVRESTLFPRDMSRLEP